MLTEQRIISARKKHYFHVKYRPDIDGLRAIAVLAVISFHAFPSYIKGGFIGVDIFFVISGYLISTIIFKNLDFKNFSCFEFYARRVRRIFPALIFILVCCVSFGWFALLSDEFKQLGKHILASSAFISNLILWNEVGYFDNLSETKPLLHLWSLGIEEQFYITWPLICWISWKYNLNILKITFLLWALSFIINILWINQDAAADFYSPQTRFWELLSGSLLAWCTLYKKSVFLNIKQNTGINFYYSGRGGSEQVCHIYFSNIISCIGLILLGYGFLKINKEVGFPGGWAMVPVLGTTLIIAAGYSAWANRIILSNKLFIWFGLVSFPLYLWHWPLLSFARIIEGETPGLNIRILAVILSIVLAWFTHKFIEYPRRNSKTGLVETTVLVLLMIGVGYTGFNIYTMDGYDFRKGIKDFVNNKNELLRSPATDEECFNYIGFKNSPFAYCRFTNANANETIAVIGDSHAHVAYPGIAEFLKEKSVNSILLANSGCPPFLGVPIGSNQSEKDTCEILIEQLLDIITKHKDIKKVFMFTRGAIYSTGIEPVTGNEVHKNGYDIPMSDLVNGAQLTINKLVNSGKSVFYITENPELNYTAGSCLNRPFKLTHKDCSVDKSTILGRQGDYLRKFNNLKNVTIIDSLSAFCPENKCVVFDDKGSILYADDDHLSIAGSRFQVTHLLRIFLY